MFYDYPITVPADTSKDAPHTEVLRVTHGVLHRVEIEFPAGCVGLVHLTITRFGHQLFPTNPSASFASDDHTITFDDYIEIYTAPYNLRVDAWSEGTTYDHTITVRLGILPQSIAEKRFGKMSTADRTRLLADLAAAIME